MTARKPLVIISGLAQELPAADIPTFGSALTTTQRDALVSPATGQRIYNSTTAQPEYYDGTIWRNYAGEPSISISQLQGYTTGNIAEVEATKALRVDQRPFDVDRENDHFIHNDYALGTDLIPLNATTSAGVDLPFCIVGWFSSGFAIIRQIRVTFLTSALSGTRNGTCNAKLWKMDSAIGLSNASAILPDGGASPQAGTSRYTHGLITRQPPPQLNIGTGGNISVGANNNVTETNPLNAIYGECKNAIGTHIQNQSLFESKTAEVPLYLLRYQGFYISFSYPAAVTSQTVNAQINIRWDEFIPARGV